MARRTSSKGEQTPNSDLERNVESKADLGMGKTSQKMHEQDIGSDRCIEQGPDPAIMNAFARTSNLPLRHRAPFSLGSRSRGLASLTCQMQHTQPFVIRPSEAELHNKLLAPRNLELAVRHLHADGLVVVEDVVPHEDLETLNEKMVKDARYLQSLGDKGPFNYNQGNLQQDPPPVAKYFYRSIFTSLCTFCLMS